MIALVYVLLYSAMVVGGKGIVITVNALLGAAVPVEFETVNVTAQVVPAVNVPENVPPVVPAVNVITDPAPIVGVAVRTYVVALFIEL